MLTLIYIFVFDLLDLIVTNLGETNKGENYCCKLYDGKVIENKALTEKKKKLEDQNKNMTTGKTLEISVALIMN